MIVQHFLVFALFFAIGSSAQEPAKGGIAEELDIGLADLFADRLNH